MVWVPTYAILHHSAGNETLQELAALRYYHHCVGDTPAGPRLLQSVSIDRKTRYAVGGGNSVCYSVCVPGNFEIEIPSQALLNFLVQVFAARCRAWSIPVERIMSHGDFAKTVARPRYGTACCGRHLQEKLPWIRASVARYL